MSELDIAMAKLRGRRLLVAEATLDEFDAHMSSIDNIDMDLSGGDNSSGKPKSSSASNPSMDMPDLNISDDISSIGGMDDADASAASTNASYDDIGSLDDINLDDIGDTAADDGGVTDDINEAGGDMSTSEIDAMMKEFNDSTSAVGATDPNAPGNPDDPAVSDAQDGDDDYIGVEDDNASDGTAPVSALSPEDEAIRRVRFIKIIEKMRDIYKGKIKKFKDFELPTDKEKIYGPVLTSYQDTFDLLEEYILGKMKTDDSFMIMKRIVDYNALFTIINERVVTLTELIKKYAK